MSPLGHGSPGSVRGGGQRNPRRDPSTSVVKGHKIVVVATPEKSVDSVAVRLGEALQKARAAAGVSRAELARRLGVIPNYLYRWETGERRVDVEVILESERVMGLRAGTVYRLAGYVDDDGLVDVDTIPSPMGDSVRLLIAEARRREQAAGDGVDG